MKFNLMSLLILLVVLAYKAQGIRHGKVSLSDTNHQDIFKVGFTSKRKHSR
ncbi:hypothetical protein M8C21_008742 [Ambrosia artemisiifolia]|uniref:Uncharacterized protein n=1 Tax=Ambrosia artemisiifolia TaxID=4212 RepID=A0AAD5DB45_AMBAR|nr:hypothetical protein M8C21_008742 [Ambrosia artemisiifolia]